MTSDESVEAAVKELIRKEGRIDLPVNNAGFGVAPAGAEESSIEQAKSIFDTNFYGLLRMTRAAVPTCVSRKAAESSILARYWAFCRCNTAHSIRQPSTLLRVILNRSTISYAQEELPNSRQPKFEEY